MLADFLAVVPQTSSLVLITYRPEYHGVLASLTGVQTIALAPLSDAETAWLVADLLGRDPSVSQIGAMIAERAAGNPFFAEEITRDLAERGVLVGKSGGYTCHTDVADVRCRPRCRPPSPPVSTDSAGRRNTRLRPPRSSAPASIAIC